MKQPNLKIKHKLLLLILLLVTLVSASIIGSTVHFSRDGKVRILNGVTRKLEDLQVISVSEFNKFTRLANEGIRRASGLVAIETIVSIALDSQDKLAAVIADAIESIGNDVTGTLESQDHIIRKGLDDLLAGSSDAMKEIIRMDKKSQELLAHVATYSMTSLNASMLDSLERFTRLFGSLESRLQDMVNQNGDEMDKILIELITRQENPSFGPEQTLAFIMDSLNRLKQKNEEQKNILFSNTYAAFTEQKKVMDTELKLVNKKIRYAIQSELGYAGIKQADQVDQIIIGLRKNQVAVMASMGRASELLNQAVAQLRTNMPIKIMQAGDEAGNKILEQTADAGNLAAAAHKEVVAKVNDNMEAALAKFESGIRDSKAVIEQTLDKSTQMTMGYSLAIAAVCMLIAVGIGFFITRSVTTPLTRVVALTEKMSEGDFTQSIEMKRNDEIGQLVAAMKTMRERLKQTISSVSIVTDDVNTSAQEISSSVQEQASVAAQQSSSVSEISATIEEFSQTSSQIARNAESVAEIAASTLEESKRGAEAAKGIVMRMEEINRENQQSIGEIVELGQKSKAITKFMEIINNIADQTKLIAFNAALEASSAGEAGRRFGVVAAEIRRLADNVMESTGEIELKINEIQEAFNHLVVASEKGAKKIQEGMNASSRTAEMLEELLTEARLTEDSAKQISLSTQQQKTASEQVVTALKEIATGAKQTTDAINQVNGVSTKLADLSGSLKNLMGKFKVGEGDKKENKQEV